MGTKASEYNSPIKLLSQAIFVYGFDSQRCAFDYMHIWIAFGVQFANLRNVAVFYRPHKNIRADTSICQAKGN